MWRLLSQCGLALVALIAGAWVSQPSATTLAPAEGLAAQGSNPAPEVYADVAIDPGHSTWDVGAAGAGLTEHELTFDVANRVRLRLEDWGYRVRLTRTDDRRVAAVVPRDPIEATRVEQEARIAAAASAAVYVSIHFNGHPNRGLRGTETYFNGDNFRVESVLLGTLVHAELLGALHEIGYPAVDRGLREDLMAGKPYGHFFSLRGPFPSILVESLFLSNPTEGEMLHQEVVRDAIADGIARGIARYLADVVGVVEG